MKIGIMSDTHDQVGRTKIAANLLRDRGAEALIHCGDLTTPDVVYECAVLPSHFVFGNCDCDCDALERAMATIGGVCLGRGGLVTLDGRTLAVTHGDSYEELQRLEHAKPDFLFSGHTHRMIDEWRGGIRCINPGALHRAPFWSVTLLDLETDVLEILRIECTGILGRSDRYF